MSLQPTEEVKLKFDPNTKGVFVNVKRKGYFKPELFTKDPIKALQFAAEVLGIKVTIEESP